MCNHSHDSAALGSLAWKSRPVTLEPSTEEDVGDVDEPPDPSQTMSPISNHFKRTPVKGVNDHHESLLTKALLSYSDEEPFESIPPTGQRRRSITSNVSLASTTELTCDTGITTPARTNSPSPRLVGVGLVTKPNGKPHTVSILGESINQQQSTASPRAPQGAKDPVVQALEKKRCISFACVAKPSRDVQTPPPPRQQPTDGIPKPEPQKAPKRPAIKFACTAWPSANNGVSSRRAEGLSRTPLSKLTQKDGSPSALRKQRSPSTTGTTRSVTPRRLSQSPTVTRSKRYLTANSKDLRSECSKFHEFASDEPQEDDWIRLDDTSSKRKLTIDDTLEKENAIRKLGKEAEEEAELEDEIENEDGEGEEEEDEDDDKTAGANDDGDLEDEIELGQDDVDAEDGYSGYSSDDDGSDGYNTDNEIGFADSDDEDDGLVLWTTGEVSNLSLLSPRPAQRRTSIGETSDSSVRARPKLRGIRMKDVAVRPGTPGLPDSTDFVCGTLDEDRPLEEAYISCIAARRRVKLQLIPQDIDPSFPTSEPEDDGDSTSKRGYQGNDDYMWPHGELEDIHHENDRGDRRKVENTSPRRHHSPPPRRHHSPAPKARGRSPLRLFDRQSPRRYRSPPPAHGLKSPPASPIQPGQEIAFRSLALRPGLVYTKSLPKTPTVFANAKKRGRSGTLTKENHVRGAIDIVKGLEQKRKRRKEKFYQKYCSRARKHQAHERRPAPGQGAQRMREVGLIMAGKIGPGNYVLSI